MKVRNTKRLMIMAAGTGGHIFPGIAISLAVFGTNLFGDALRDILDPRQRG